MAVEVRGDLGHFIIIEGLASSALDMPGQPIRGSDRPMPQCRSRERDGDPAKNCQRASPGRRTNESRFASGGADDPKAKADQPRNQAAGKAGYENGPEIAPQDVHAVSRASSRQ